MTPSRKIMNAAIAALTMTLGLFALQAAAQQPAPVQVAQADCYSIGLRVASDNGGELARAEPTTVNGQQMCRIVILVPGKNGERPRRTEFIVPAG